MHTFEEGYEWDQRKADANLAKHGIDFAHAVEALLDERALTVADKGSSEERYVSFGMDALGRVIAVVYTWRGDVMRIISARQATRTEARSYAAANQ